MSAAAMREPDDYPSRPADSPGRLMAIEALLQQIARSMQQQDERSERDTAQLRRDMESMEQRILRQLEKTEARLDRVEADTGRGLGEAMSAATQNRQQINFWRGALAMAALLWAAILSVAGLVFGGLFRKLWE